MFEEELSILENKIKENKSTKDLIAFYGSSSIRLWKTLSQDLSPLNCINLGFGGSTIPDCIEESERILFPLTPSEILFYIGDNDIGNGASASEVFQNFKTLFYKTRKALPNTVINYASIKPSPSREHLRADIESANFLIKEFITSQDNAEYLNLYDSMILPNGGINKELFIEDELHLNEQGYTLWKKLYRDFLI